MCLVQTAPSAIVFIFRERTRGLTLASSAVIAPTRTRLMNNDWIAGLKEDLRDREDAYGFAQSELARAQKEALDALRRLVEAEIALQNARLETRVIG